MAALKKQVGPKKIVPTSIPVATSATTPVSVSAPPGSGTGATASSTAVSTLPPVLTIPAPPPGFVSVNFKDYRGSYPNAAEFTAIPDAVQELKESTSYDETFGGAVPEAEPLAGELDTASRWTAIRVALEAYLLYVRSVEAITWKAATTDLNRLRASFDVVETLNPALIAAFPATKRLLDVQKVIGQRAAATRARLAKAKQAANPGSGAAAAPATTPAATAVPVANAALTGGGLTH